MDTPQNPGPTAPTAQPETAPDLPDERLGNSPFPIVGIGASAGGLEAFTQVLAQLPEQTGMAFLLVQHLDPTHESQLTELLAKVTRIPILEATDDLEVRPNHIYIIPPNANMALSKGHLRITRRAETRTPHLPVDFLFRSLAQDQQSRAIGVVLSGSGSDGTLGLVEIKAAGGITFAQDELTAKHSGMPTSAMGSGSVDFVLPPGEIAHRLAEVGGHPYLAPSPPAPAEFEAAEDHYRKILTTVRGATGVDFSLYRDTTIRRRIMRRMALHGYQDLADYSAMLGTNHSEAEALYGDLLINVTSFFRDPPMFEALKTNAFPEVMKRKLPTNAFRVWVPGCSTGQEAYSLAMVLWEFFDDKPIRPLIQVFATDLSDQFALEKARAGLYPESIEAEVSAERLRRFFKREDHLYRIDKSIRDACIFARQNIAVDPPFSHVDLISCRNVLIYMAPALQKRILPIFHYALSVPGYLVLGSAETVGEFGDLFEIVDRANKIFVKRQPNTRSLAFFTPEEFRVGFDIVQRHSRPMAQHVPDYQKEADRIVMGRYAPSGVLVTSTFDVAQFRGRTDRFLEIPMGEPTTNLLRMAREGLFLDLRSALNEARSRQHPVRREGLHVRGEHGTLQVNLEILPIKPMGATEDQFLVLFHEAGITPLPKPPAPLAAIETNPMTSIAPPPESTAPPHGWLGRFWGRGSDPHATAQISSSASSPDKEESRLRHELAATREYMQSLVEQQDAANEELQSANEEILSANEELQSTNEELQTAKEELQSTNEELSTINEQLQHRNLELNQYTNDLTNLLTSTTIPVVMVGSDLRIRRVTAPARKVMNLLPTDAGRSISDFKANVNIEDLEAMISEVIESVHVQEREVQDHEGHWYLLRVHPYRTADNKIDGAVIVLLDIDQIKRAQEEARESRSRLTAEVEAMSRLYQLTGNLTTSGDLRIALEKLLEESLNILGTDQGIVQLHDPASRILSIVTQRGLTDEFLDRFRTVGLFHGSAGSRALESRKQVLIEDVMSDPDYAPHREVAAAAGYRSVLATPVLGRDGEVVAVLSANFREPHRPSERELRVLDLFVQLAVNFIERVRAESALKEADQRKNEFMATLAHELRNPLAPIRNAVQILKLSDGKATGTEEICDILDRQSQQLSRIVEDLIDMSRIIQGKIDLRKQHVALDTVVTTAVESMRSFIEARRHQFTVKLPTAPIYLDADPVRLAQVLVNLLNNAAKFTKSGGRIDLTAEEDTTRNQVVISVRDTGEGLSAELQPNLFSMFTQGDRSFDRMRSGLGVGLALVKSLVELHEGTVEAHSEGPDKGSEFLIRLPLAPIDFIAKPQAPERVKPPPAIKPRRILVIDDNEDQVRSLATLLKLLGHEVQTAHDGSNAVALAETFVPDLALVDIGLPGMNGYDVARRLRQIPKLQKALLVAQTGWGQDDDRRRSELAGFDRHLVKPVEIEEIQQLLVSLPDGAEGS
jgi:two-component system CheB/CheR fusion protein